MEMFNVFYILPIVLVVIAVNRTSNILKGGR